MPILSHEQMAVRSAALQREGKRVVFTNGCFDLIHRGHIELLKEAKSAGDHLLVAVNSDESVRTLKGDNRPILPEEDRAAILDAFGMVDDVTIFEEKTPEKLIQMVKPNVLVKGSDYGEGDIVGAAVVKSWGGEVVTVPLVKGRGTRQMIEKIVAAYGGENS